MRHSYPWYITDWLTSETRSKLSMAGRGLYRDMLDYCYLEGSLPADRKLLASCLCADGNQLRYCLEAVLRLFVLKDGRYHHPKVDEVLARLEGYDAQKKAAGVKSGEVRARSKGDVEKRTSVPTENSPRYEPSTSTTTSTYNPPTPLSALAALGWKGGWKFVKNASDAMCDQILKMREADFTESADLDSPCMIWARLNWFEEFWVSYWLRKNKKKARALYFAVVRTLEMHDRIIEAVNAQSEEMLAKPESKRPHATTWINGERWDDAVQRSLEAGAGE